MQSTTATRKHSALTVDTATPPFLPIEFDRDGFLRLISEFEPDRRKYGRISKPEISWSINRLHVAGASTGSPMAISRSHITSPQKKPLARSHGFKHLSNRQPIANVIRILPNLNLYKFFGNMVLSSSIQMINCPSDAQDAQVSSSFIPTMTVSILPGPGSLKNAFHGIHAEVPMLVEAGPPVELVI